MSPLEAVETAAWAQQYAGLDPDLRALTVPLGPLHAFGVGAWPDSAWHHVVTGLGEDTATLDPALALLQRLGAVRPVLQVVDGAAPSEVREKFSATRLANGKTVDEPTARMPEVPPGAPAFWFSPQAVSPTRAIAETAANRVRFMDSAPTTVEVEAAWTTGL